jgi:hypothetical protein
VTASYQCNTVRRVIGLQTGRRATRLPGHLAALLFALLVALTAHLMSTGHNSAFSTALHDAPAVAQAPQAEHGAGPSAEHRGAHAPAHPHSADQHIDHAVDRPRASAEHTTVAPADAGAPLIAALALPWPAAAMAAGSLACRPRAPNGRRLLLLHCVRRQ